MFSLGGSNVRMNRAVQNSESMYLISREVYFQVNVDFESDPPKCIRNLLQLCFGISP